jgi:hypothetical protein
MEAENAVLLNVASPYLEVVEGVIVASVAWEDASVR